MNMQRNYQKELDQIISHIVHVNNSAGGLDAGSENRQEGRFPSLLLHACCAPCSSYCLEYLSRYFRITVFNYNPNISPESEYRHRVAEIRRLIEEAPAVNPVQLIEGRYEPEKFFAMAKGLEDVPEGGARCFACYRLRLQETLRIAQEGGFDYAATTLTISPLKNAARLNEIGEELAAGTGTAWLPSDFKKKNGYKRSVELSAQYHLYRQNYCGCIFSRREAELREQKKAEQQSEKQTGVQTGIQTGILDEENTAGNTEA